MRMLVMKIMSMIKKFQLNLKRVGYYHYLYLKTNILLLADVFEQFREMCWQSYKLDPCHYFTSPGLGWDAILKMTGVKLDLISDIDMYKGMVNNKCMI